MPAYGERSLAALVDQRCENGFQILPLPEHDARAESDFDVLNTLQVQALKHVAGGERVVGGLTQSLGHEREALEKSEKTVVLVSGAGLIHRERRIDLTQSFRRNGTFQMDVQFGFR